MDRLTWALLAVLLVLSGLYMLGHVPVDWISYLLIGIALGGIGCALAGSLLRDVLVRRRHS